jgi:hypothetical protein
MRLTTSLSTTVTQYNGVFTGIADQEASMTSGDLVQSIIAVPGSLKELRVALTVAPGAGKSRTIRFYRNGSVEAAADILISDAATTGSVTLGSPIALSAGDRVYLELVATGTPAACRMSFGIRYEVTNLGQCQWTTCQPDLIGTTNARFHRLNGGSVTGEGYSTTRVQQLYAGVTAPLVLSGMEVRLNGAPTAGKSYKFEVELNAAIPAPTVDVTIADAATTGNSAADDLEITDGDFVVTKVTPTGTPTNRQASWALIVSAPTPDFNEDLEAIMEGVGELYEDEGAIDIDGFTVDGPPGLTWIELTASTDAVYSFSDREIPDPSSYPGYLKDNRVLDFGTIDRGISDEAGRFQGTTVTSVFADHDRLLRGLLEDTFLPNRSLVYRTISDRHRRMFVTPRTIFRGLISKPKLLPDMEFQITSRDSFAAKFSLQSGANQVPRRLVGVDDFGFAPSAPTSIEKTFTTPIVAGPPGYVQLSDQAAALNLLGRISNGDYAPDVSKGWYGYNADGTEKGYDEWYLSPGDVFWATPQVAEALEKASGGTSELTSVGLRVPTIYGKISDVNVAAGGGQGQVSPIYAGIEEINGSDYHVFIVCGHAVKRITGVYINDGKTGAGTYPASAVGDLAGTSAAGAGGPWLVPGYDNWTVAFGGSAPPYEDRNGNRYTVIYGLVGDDAADIAAGFYDPLTPTTVRISLSLEGIEDVGDGTGQLIENLHLQRLHALQNWMFGDYRSGAWLASPTFPDDPTLKMIDEDSFRAAANHVNLTGAFVFGHSANNGESEVITVAEAEARFNVSSSSDTFWNRKGQYTLDYLNTTSPTIVGEHSDEQHILKSSFEVDEDLDHHYNVVPFFHTRDYCGREKSGWLSPRTGVLELRDETSIANYSPVGYEIPLQAPVQEYHMIRGRNSEAELEDYEAGNDTAEIVLNRFMLFHTNPPRLIDHSMGHDGNNYDLCQIVYVRHFGGTGTTGWTNRRCRIIRHKASPGQYRVDLKLQDLERIL